MKIALVRQRYAHDGGAERFVARTLEALKGQDVRVTLITREWQQADGFDVVTVNPFYIGRLWRDWSFARAVRKLLRERAFDVVQSHERIPGCDIYRAGDGVHREWLHQRARVLSWAGRLAQAINPDHLSVKRAEKGVFTSARLKAVICNSRMVKQEIVRRFGTADEKLHVIYNGVNLEQFHPRLRKHRHDLRARFGIPNDAPLFLFVGSGFERKGVAAALDALARLPKNAFLLVVGRDRKSKQYQKRARGLGLAERAIFVGSQADVKPFYGAADALVLPTLYDPFPNVALEAMASALAVVTSTKSGAAEVVTDGRSGYVCDALDRDALAAAMLELCNRERAAAFGGAARQAVESLGIERMTEELVALYERASEFG
jgi:UDP-glucose:(heptosyl)LPS alpha-1,3-glucosyltransferase